MVITMMFSMPLGKLLLLLLALAGGILHSSHALGGTPSVAFNESDLETEGGSAIRSHHEDTVPESDGVDLQELSSDVEVALPPKLEKRLESLVDAAAIPGGTAVMKELELTLDAAADYFSEYDSTGASPELQAVIDSLSSHLRAAKENAVRIASSSTEEQLLIESTRQDNERGNVDFDVSALDKAEPTFSSFRRLNENGQDSREEKSSSSSSGKDSKQKKNHYRFNKFKFPPKHRHYFDLLDAIHRGDSDFVQRKMEAMSHHANVHHDSFHGRRAEAGDATRRAQCELLVSCVETLTLYDLIVYFYNDDIDFDKGEFTDDPIKKFDDMDIFAKAEQITDALQAVKDNDYANGKCDDLLIEFHRIEESSDGDQIRWIGGIVTEVCLASGTTQYVKTAEIEKNIGEGAAILIFEDLILCARDLFDSDDRTDRFNGLDGAPRNDKFVFLSLDGKKLRLPIGLREDYEQSRDKHGRLKTLNPYRLYTYRNLAIDLAEDPATADYEFPTENQKNACAAAVEPLLTEVFFSLEAGISRINAGDDSSDVVVVRVVCDQKDDLCCGTDGIDGPFLAKPLTRSMRTLGGCQKAVAPWAKCKSYKCSIEVDGDVLANAENCKDYDDTTYEGRTSCKEGSDDISNGKCDFLRAKSPLQGTSGETLDDSAQLIFGSKPSVGKICGIRAAVTSGKATIPGYCCLDSPAESFDEDGMGIWGQPYQCGETCTKYAPYLAGINEEACDVYAGKWCPNPQDCSELKDCIEKEYDCAIDEDRTSFALFLESSPIIASGDFDPMDVFSCGRAREYFGFDATFPNDSQICIDVNQLRFTRDFSILDDFLSGASAGGPGGENDKFMLQKPKEAAYTDDQGQDWRKWNFGLRQAFEFIQSVYDNIAAVECPSTTGINEGCVVVKGATLIKVQIFLLTLLVAVEVSEFIYREEVGTNEVLDTLQYNNIDVIFENMETSLNYTKEVIFEEVVCRESERKPSSTRGYGCDGIDNNCNKMIDECDEDETNPVIDDEKVESACGSKFVFASEALALACVQKHVSVSDDCDEVITRITSEVTTGTDTTSSTAGTDATSSISTDTSSSTSIPTALETASLCGKMIKITIEAEEKECEKITRESFFVLVDENIPANPGVCELSRGPDVSPRLSVSRAVEFCGGKTFMSVAAAKECILANSEATDDCRPVDVTAVAEKAENKCEYVIRVTAKLKGCDEESLVAKSIPILLFVDTTIPAGQLVCELPRGPNVPPTLTVLRAIDLCGDMMFKSVEAAKDCVLANSEAADDCSRAVDITAVAKETENKCEYTIEVTAKRNGCDGDFSLETKSAPIRVLIDNEPPEPTCSFLDDTLISSGRLENPEFQYTVSDNCGGPLSVKVETFSNERDLQSEPLAVQFQSLDANGNPKVGIYIRSSICPYSDSHSGSKEGMDDCINDPLEPGRRFYLNRVSATDKAGLVKSVDCYLEIIKPTGKGKGKGMSPSSRRKLQNGNYTYGTLGNGLARNSGSKSSKSRPEPTPPHLPAPGDSVQEFFIAKTVIDDYVPDN